jgi:thiamine-monophosphate kinase
MKVSEVGEFGLIDILARMVEEAGIKGFDRHTGQGLLLGIGDDTSAWAAETGVQLATTDTLVQGVHFIPDVTSWQELGWKALAVNLSDIAAMGGEPWYALITLGLPSDTEVENIKELYRGMLEIARQYGVVIAGGDIVGSPVFFITLALIGGAQKGLDYPSNMLRRSAAMRGDLVAVTGYLGAAAGGLKMLQQGITFDLETTAYLKEAHLRPKPRIEAGKALLKAGISAAMDISDGLLADLSKLCQASAVAACIQADQVPVHPLLKAGFGEESLTLALSGGEDYELLFTGTEEVVERARGLIQEPVAVIGKIVEGKAGQVSVIDRSRKLIQPSKGGWDHFVA